MSNKNSKVNWFFTKAEKWRKELTLLRTIILDCGLAEELKWGCPCYTFDSHNIVLLHTFKEYCAVLFFKGALIKDEYSVLVQQTKNVQATRQIRFDDIREVAELEPVVKAYIQEAIEVEKAGLKVTLKKTAEFEIPEEFQLRLDEIPAVKKAFYALTPGRQRGYLLHFAAPKQSKTRESRIEKCIAQILKGKGLDDR